MSMSEEGIKKLKELEMNHLGNLDSLNSNIEEVNEIISFVGSIKKDFTTSQSNQLEEKLIQLIANIR